MENGIFALIPEARLRDVLGALHECCELPVRLLDEQGGELASFGKAAPYCAVVRREVFGAGECQEAHRRAAEQSRLLGEAYIFSCRAGLNHIAFPLVDRYALLGSVLIGPFLMDAPDSTLVNSLMENEPLSLATALELFEESRALPVVPPRRVTSLSRLVDHLLSPLLPGERAQLLLAREKLSQQSLINETIQRYKEQDVPAGSYEYYHEKEGQLLSRAKAGDTEGAKALLADLMAYALMDGSADDLRMRGMELTTLLSRVAMDGGAKVESVHLLAGRFLPILQAEKSFESICLLVQEALVSFMEAMYSAQDKGNPYVRRALRFMSRRYFQPLTMASVAAEVGLSANYFSALFRRVVGESFSDRLNRIRIEESKRLLLATDDPIAQIAVSIGFSDQSYFCKVFRRYVGVSPGRFRS